MNELISKAKQIRLNILKDIFRTKKGHIGGTYSCVELFVYMYYGKYGLNFHAYDPRWNERDRFVVGKGHASLALYHIWMDLGILYKCFFSNYGENGSYLSTQLNIDTPGVEYNSGSLGNAIGIAAGMALAAKMDHKSYTSFALIGDGECGEGSIWESLMFASDNNLCNLIGIIDCNRLGVTDFVSHSNEINNLNSKIKAFGWDTKIIDGHNFEEIEEVLKNKNNFSKPFMIIANTIKGKGVSFMENGVKWHHSVPTQEEYELALKELGE